jgi:hypothetical protein
MEYDDILDTHLTMAKSSLLSLLKSAVITAAALAPEGARARVPAGVAENRAMEKHVKRANESKCFMHSSSRILVPKTATERASNHTKCFEIKI